MWRVASREQCHNVHIFWWRHARRSLSTRTRSRVAKPLYWLVAWSVPSHYLNQCWNIVNWTPRNKLQWNVNRNSYIFIQENPFENVVWKMAAILSRPQCVKGGSLVIAFVCRTGSRRHFFTLFLHLHLITYIIPSHTAMIVLMPIIFIKPGYGHHNFFT